MRLDLFSQKRLHEALTEAGHAVSLRTVRRWVEGDQEPSSAWRDVIEEVVGATQNEPPGPPEWVEGLEARLVAEVRTNREVVVAALAAQIGQAVGEALAELPTQLPESPAPAAVDLEE